MGKDPFSILISMMNGGNPQQMLQNAMMNNSKNNQMATQLQNSIQSSGMTSEQYAIQFFKQRGISEQQVREIARRFGAK